MSERETTLASGGGGRADRSKAPPRVVYVNHVARLSGGEIALARLLKALEGLVSAHVILGEDGPLVERLREAGAEVEVLPIAPRVRDTRKDSISPRRLDLPSATGALRYVWRLRRRLRELEPDLVHTNSLKAALYGGLAGRLAGLPVLWHIRDRIAEDYLPSSAVRLVRLASRVLPKAIVANSKTTLATLPARRRRHVLYGLVTDPFETPRAVHRATPQLTIGMVGRISRWKGQHVFLEAFAEAFRGEPVCARIVGSAMFGEDEYEAQLRRQVAELGVVEQVEFRGFRDDIWSELLELDVLVHCSITPEPFGQVVIEGMAAGLPVVAAAAGGPAEVIENGVNGFLSPPGDAKKLARVLRRLADDPELRRRIGAVGRETSRSFSPERAAEEMTSIYDEILTRRRRGGPPAQP
jgi:glycosyltransferase involved in cell wall biosynthesis